MPQELSGERAGDRGDLGRRPRGDDLAAAVAALRPQVDHVVRGAQDGLVVLHQQKELTLQKTAEAKANLMASEAAVNEATQKIKRVEQQLASMPDRVVTQSRSLPNQYSAERLNTMMVELQNRRTQLLTKFKPDDRLVREIDEQIRITREALEKAEGKSAVEEATGLNPLRQTLETELARARLPVRRR